jgi:hypothetical protein
MNALNSMSGYHVDKLAERGFASMKACVAAFVLDQTAGDRGQVTHQRHVCAFAISYTSVVRHCDAGSIPCPYKADVIQEC